MQLLIRHGRWGTTTAPASTRAHAIHVGLGLAVCATFLAIFWPPAALVGRLALLGLSVLILWVPVRDAIAWSRASPEERERFRAAAASSVADQERARRPLGFWRCLALVALFTMFPGGMGLNSLAHVLAAPEERNPVPFLVFALMVPVWIGGCAAVIYRYSKDRRRRREEAEGASATLP